MKRPMTAAAMLFAWFVLGVCTCWASELDKYFPKKEGMTWEYNLTSDKNETRKIVITNMAPRELKGKTVLPKKWDIGGNIRYDFFAEDGDGIYLYAKQEGEAGKPEILEKKEYYLRNPLGKGTTWDVVTKFGQEDIKLNLTIESNTDTVTSPAGIFTDCLKVKHEGGGKEKDGTTLTVTAYEWYAPKVGWVKSVVTIGKKTARETTKESQTFLLQTYKP